MEFVVDLSFSPVTAHDGRCLNISPRQFRRVREIRNTFMPFGLVVAQSLRSRYTTSLRSNKQSVGGYGGRGEANNRLGEQRA